MNNYKILLEASKLSRAVDKLRIAELEAAVCDYSHKKHWIGEKENPGCCFGCGRHRSLIRDQAAQTGDRE